MRAETGVPCEFGVKGYVVRFGMRGYWLTNPKPYTLNPTP